ncbi:MAG: hypothetical protein J7498_10480 [Sphingobium sp.]|nr:hypothetical protein [Sphingobium sp.]
MKARDQIYPLQERFIPVAETRLPPDPSISWNSYGVMTYFWPSVCDRIEGLWVNVNEHEIMLATALSHTHIDEREWNVRQSQSGDVLDRIVEQGIAQALNILGGETFFVKTYDPEGHEHSSSGMSPRQLWNDPEQKANWTKFQGEGWTARAWNWRGEVKD